MRNILTYKKEGYHHKSIAGWSSSSTTTDGRRLGLASSSLDKKSGVRRAESGMANRTGAVLASAISSLVDVRYKSEGGLTSESRASGLGLCLGQIGLS